MYPSLQDSTKNRGFLFAEFENHREAAMAKRQLIPGTVKFWDNDVVVDWADPEPDIDPAIMAGVRFFFRNLIYVLIFFFYFRLINFSFVM